MRLFCWHKLEDLSTAEQRHYWTYSMCDGFNLQGYEYSEIMSRCTKCGVVKVKRYVYTLPPFESSYGGKHFINGVSVHKY